MLQNNFFRLRKPIPIDTFWEIIEFDDGDYLGEGEFDNSVQIGEFWYYDLVLDADKKNVVSLQENWYECGWYTGYANFTENFYKVKKQYERTIK